MHNIYIIYTKGSQSVNETIIDRDIVERVLEMDTNIITIMLINTV